MTENITVAGPDPNTQVERAKRDSEAGNVNNLTIDNYPDVPPARLTILKILAHQALSSEAWPARNIVRSDPDALLSIVTYIQEQAIAAQTIAKTLPSNEVYKPAGLILWLSPEEIKILELAVQYGDSDTFDPKINPIAATLPEKIRARMYQTALENDEAFKKRDKRKPAPGLTLDQLPKKD